MLARWTGVSKLSVGVIGECVLRWVVSPDSPWPWTEHACTENGWIFIKICELKICFPNMRKLCIRETAESICGQSLILSIYIMQYAVKLFLRHTCSSIFRCGPSGTWVWNLALRDASLSRQAPPIEVSCLPSSSQRPSHKTSSYVITALPGTTLELALHWSPSRSKVGALL